MLLAGCSKASEDSSAVRQGVIDYLSSRSGLDVNSMDIEVTSVQFHDGQADATVSFHAKGSSDPAAGMQMQYTLERAGNRWVVKNKAGSGAHSGAGDSPQGGAMPQSEMPPGHPPTGAMPQGAMPQGHPPVSEPETTNGTE